MAAVVIAADASRHGGGAQDGTLHENTGDSNQSRRRLGMSDDVEFEHTLDSPKQGDRTTESEGVESCSTDESSSRSSSSRRDSKSLKSPSQYSTENIVNESSDSETHSDSNSRSNSAPKRASQRSIAEEFAANITRAYNKKRRHDSTLELETRAGRKQNPSDTASSETLYGHSGAEASELKAITPRDADPFADARAAGKSHYRIFLYSVLDGPSVDLGVTAKRVSVIWQLFVTGCIIASIVSFLISSLPINWNEDVPVLFHLEIFIVAVFTFDYMSRLLLTPYPRFALPYAYRCIKPKRGIATSRELRTGFVWIFLNLVDLFSVAPFYIELIITAMVNGQSNVGQAFAAVRVLRLFRLARVLKVGRYVAILQVVGATIRRSFAALLLLVFSVFVAGLLYGAVEFYAENFSACTFVEKENRWVYKDSMEPSPFQSVFDGVWWAIVTLTTVGYGDKFPLSWPGQLVAVMTILSGLIVLAFPITIISSHFVDIVRENKAAMEEKKIAGELSLSVDMDISNHDLRVIMRGELRKQADVINQLQETVDSLASSWRIAEAAFQVFELRTKHLEVQQLGRHYRTDANGHKTSEIDIENGKKAKTDN